MIAVIGGVKVKIDIKMQLPEAPKQPNWTEELEKETAQPSESYDAIMERMRAQEQMLWEGEGRQQAPSPFGPAGDSIDGSRDEIKVLNTGCAYNVATRLADMGREVTYITAIGSDPLGFAAEAELMSHGVDISAVKKVQGQTPLLFELKNFAGEIEFARFNENLYAELTPEFLESKSDVLAAAEAIVIDGTLPADSITYLAGKYGDSVKIFFDPASREGGDKVKATGEVGAEVLSKLYCVAPGRSEAEKMTDTIILGLDKLKEAGNLLASSGVNRSFITMKGGGVYYIDGEAEGAAEGESGRGIVKPERVLHFAETTGAGDLVTAVIVDETLKGSDVAATAEAAMAAAGEFLSGLSDERAY